jgi:serine/threonine protein kinase
MQDYEEVKCIGRGNYGSAHLVKHRITGVRWVCKVGRFYVLNFASFGRPQGGWRSHPYPPPERCDLLMKQKVPIELLSASEKLQARQEVDLLSRLKHSNIVEYRDSFVENDTLHIIMAYCEGGDLSKLIKLCAKEKRTLDERVRFFFSLSLSLCLSPPPLPSLIHSFLRACDPGS